MKVLIISDTHGKSSCLKQIHDIVGDVEMLIHLGDVEGDEKLIHDLFDCEIHMVRGNCDYNPELPIYDEFNIGDKRAFITHGHRYGVNSGISYLEELIDTEGYDFVMYGHTHRRLSKFLFQIDLYPFSHDNLGGLPGILHDVTQYRF